MPCFAAPFTRMPPPFWIALAILGFLVWWPLGLGLAVCLSGSAIMWCCGFGHAGSREHASPRMQDGSAEPRRSGNAAFDEYRAEALRRLETEQREFADFLAHLRDAKDKAEFDAFMAERRAHPQPPSARPA